MTDKIKVNIVSDVVCPWCIIGYKRLSQAISEMGIQDRVEIEWHPFELNPNMPAEGENVQEHVAHKYGMTLSDGNKSRESMTKLGDELGFKFNFFAEMKIVNTRDAHILLDYAKESGKQTELKLCLFKAYFTDQKDISDRKILIQELQSIGLNADEALARLEDSGTRERVQTQETHWRGLGVDTVPTIVFNQQQELIGAQPVDAYKQVLAKLMADKGNN